MKITIIKQTVHIFGVSTKDSKIINKCVYPVLGINKEYDVGNNYNIVTATACASVVTVERFGIEGTEKFGEIIGATDNSNGVPTNCITNHAKVHCGATKNR